VYLAVLPLLDSAVMMVVNHFIGEMTVSHVKDLITVFHVILKMVFVLNVRLPFMILQVAIFHALSTVLHVIVPCVCLVLVVIGVMKIVQRSVENVVENPVILRMVNAWSVWMAGGEKDVIVLALRHVKCAFYKEITNWSVIVHLVVIRIRVPLNHSNVTISHHQQDQEVALVTNVSHHCTVVVNNTGIKITQAVASG